MSKKNEVEAVPVTVEDVNKKADCALREIEQVKAKIGSVQNSADFASVIVKKLKEYLERVMGADIDGDGRVGRGPTKLAAFIVLAGLAATCVRAGPANTNIAVWYGTEAAPQTYIDGSGGLHAPTLGVSNVDLTGSLTVDGNATVDGAVTAGTAQVTGTLGVGGVVTLSSNVGIGVNATVGGALTTATAKVRGELDVDGNTTLTNVEVEGLATMDGLTASKVVFTDSNKRLTSTGTVGIDQGGTGDGGDWTDHGIMLGSGSGALSVTAAGTDGQLLIGRSSKDPEFTTLTGDVGLSTNGVFSITAGSIVTADLATAEAASLALADTAAQKSEVWGTPTIASEYSAGVLISTNVVTVKNLNGDTIADYALVRVWLTSAANAVSHDGTEVEKTVDKKDYTVVTKNDGTVTFTITEAATTTNTLSVSVGPNIASTNIPLSD